MEQRSTSCIRFGEYESLNFIIGMLPEDVAILHAFYRTSIEGRKDFLKLSTTDINDVDSIMELKDSYTSRIGEILNVKFKNLGIRLSFYDDEQLISAKNNIELRAHEYKGKNILCTDYQFYLMEMLDKIRDYILSEQPVISASELNERSIKILKSGEVVNGVVCEDLLKLLPDAETVIEKAQEAFSEVQSMEDTKEEVPEVEEKPKKKRKK